MLFCFFPYLLFSHVCAFYFFLHASTQYFLHLCLVRHLFHSPLSWYLQGVWMTGYSPWVLLLYYSINNSSINSVIVLLAVVPSIYTLHFQCPIHPISPYFLAVSHPYIPPFQLSFHPFTLTTRVLSAVNLSISTESLSLLAFNLLICSLQVYLSSYYKLS